MPESRFKNANTLKGGNYWQNYVSQNPLYDDDIPLLRSRGSIDKSKDVFRSLYDFLGVKTSVGKKGLDIDFFERGKFAFPIGKDKLLYGKYNRARGVGE